MNHRAVASRLVTVATAAALLLSTVGLAVADARDPGWSEPTHVEGPSTRSDSRRPERTIRVADLPDASRADAPLDEYLTRPSPRRTASPSVTALLPPTLATTNADPAIRQATAFDGMYFAERLATQGEPPDPFVAVGPEHVMQAVNTTFRISSRTGAAIDTIDLVDFFGISSIPDYDASVFDSRVIYDSLHGRWIAIEASYDCYATETAGVGTGWIDLAISSNADPTGTWTVRSLPFDDEIPDYPGLGTSTDKVVLGTNQFSLVPGGGPLGCSGSDFIKSDLVIMPWSQLLTTGNLSWWISSSSGAFAPRPALQTPATSPIAFVIAEGHVEGVIYVRIVGDAASDAGPTVLSVDLTTTGVVDSFALPPPPQQPGGTIANAVDARPTDAVWKGGKLASVSTYPCDPSGGAVETRDCVRVTELSTTNTGSPTKIQDFLIAQNTFDSYMGGIGYALNDDLHVVWTRSSGAAGQYPSSYGAYQSATRPNGTLSARARLTAGTGSYPGDRWGDYVGVAQDPQVPNAVWQGNQYSSGPTYWATEITQNQTGGSSYVPIPPVRVLDTRFATGLSGVFMANVPRSFEVAGSFGIPANAVAVTGNVTIANQTSAGYLSVTTTPVVNPQSSTINVPLGDTRANNITMPIAADGTLSAVYKAPAGRSTHVIFDVTGYFLAGDTEATYATITPVRVLDSRSTFSIGLAGKFLPNLPRTLSIAGANGVPADATAITGNLTVVGQTRAGYLSITPDPEANPATSTLNFPTGDTRANGVSVPLNASGDLSIVFKASGGSTDVILDVTGYYREDPSGLKFFPLTPGRIMDTRPNVVLSGLSGVFASSTPRQLRVARHWGVPITGAAITGNLTVVGQSAAGYVAATLASDATPDTSVLNFPLGDIRANGVTLPLNAEGREWFVYKATGGKTTHLILDVSGYFD
jgi:hypothetical protein